MEYIRAGGEARREKANSRLTRGRLYPAEGLHGHEFIPRSAISISYLANVSGCLANVLRHPSCLARGQDRRGDVPLGIDTARSRFRFVSFLVVKGLAFLSAFPGRLPKTICSRRSYAPLCQRPLAAIRFFPERYANVRTQRYPIPFIYYSALRVGEQRLENRGKDERGR